MVDHHWWCRIHYIKYPKYMESIVAVGVIVEKQGGFIRSSLALEIFHQQRSTFVQGFYYSFKMFLVLGPILGSSWPGVIFKISFVLLSRFLWNIHIFKISLVWLDLSMRQSFAQLFSSCHKKYVSYSPK